MASELHIADMHANGVLVGKQAVSGEAAHTLQQLQAQLESVPQPRQSTGHSHRMCWALAPPSPAAANGDPQRFPDNCIDGDLLARCSHCVTHLDNVVLAISLYYLLLQLARLTSRGSGVQVRLLLADSPIESSRSTRQMLYDLNVGVVL